jgi:selenocysteine lyase/cysteine desulfurase
MMSSPIGRRSFLSKVAVPGLAATIPRRLRACPTAPPSSPSADDDAAVFAEARRHLLFPESVTYCNTGTLGASPREVVDALAEGTRKLEAALPDWPYFQADGEPLTGYQELVPVRTAVARLVNASPDEIAITQNATMGMSFLANGLDLAAGDEIVSTDQEHPGGISAWRLQAKRRGVVVKELPLLPAATAGPSAVVKLFQEAMTPRTRALMVSHVTSGLGIKLPVQELTALARERGALSLIDGAQAVGQMRVDVRALDCDAYVASPHKWLLAPKGTGILYVRRSAQDRFATTLASTAWDDRARGAFRFMQYGTGAVPVVDGLMAALRFVGALGVDRIERWDTMLTKRLRDGLASIPKARLGSPADPGFASALSTFRVEGVTARALQDALWAKKIRVRAQGDERGVRLSAHFYVSPADIDRVLEVVESLSRGDRPAASSGSRARSRRPS